MLQTVPQAKPVHYSDHPQDPDKLLEIEGVTYVVNKQGKPLFHLDGSPVKPGGSHQCTARRRIASPYRCSRYAVTGAGYTKCQQHGAGSPMQGRPGGAPITPLSRKWSDRLPANLRQRYEVAVADPDLLALDNEIAMLDVRIGELFSRLKDEKESALHFDSLREALAQLKRAHEIRDTAGVIDAVNLITSVYDPIEQERMAWVELSFLFQQRAKLSARETDRRKAMRNYVTAEAAMALVQTMIAIVQDEVHDKETRNRISIRVELALRGAKRE